MKTLYIDMDNVLVDFPSGIAKLSTEIQKQYDGDLDECLAYSASWNRFPEL
jgi:beta-phosphoglucomutase-like phosphatase (HAD superfamily)